MKNKSKSRRRWVRNAFVHVDKGGDYDHPMLQFQITPDGDASRAVTFEVDFWQFEQMRRDAKPIIVKAAENLEQRAASYRAMISP